MSAGIWELKGYTEAMQVLASIELQMRGPALKLALKKAGNVVMTRAKQLVPQPGYPGDKPQYKPLRDTIVTVVKEGATLYAVVGPSRPGGVHGRLVEFGTKPHDIIRWGKIRKHKGAQPHPFLAPAAEQTKGQQESALMRGLQQAAERAAKRG